ncbi:MAG: hypothetical protein ACRERD_02380 [Candidatus Binatia bacterium]
MKRGADQLLRMVGNTVQSLMVEIMFFGLEQRGKIGEVSIAFEAGPRFTFGCAGDGSILVTRSHKQIADAPHTITVWRTLSGVRGELREALAEPNSLRLRIGDATLVLVNNDDEMEVTVNGESLDGKGSSLLKRDMVR